MDGVELDLDLQDMLDWIGKKKKGEQVFLEGIHHKQWSDLD